jgi:adenylate kinase family enzyme
MRLSELGERICILGPSNSGKSTLAGAIAKKTGLKPIHLDQLHHLPNTNWQPRPPDEFVALHDQAIAGDRWVMDGNYSKLFPLRFQRATGVILLDVSTGASLFRYLRRSIFQKRRIGALEGELDSVKLSMLHFIVAVTPGNRRRYQEAYQQLQLPKVYLPSMRAINALYRHWQLDRTPLPPR